jgi:hypothetical protein
MGIIRLLQWQWNGHPEYHQSRTDLLIHIFAVPPFLIGTLALVEAIVDWSVLLPGAAVGCIVSAVALQGRGHWLPSLSGHGKQTIRERRLSSFKAVLLGRR